LELDIIPSWLTVLLCRLDVIEREFIQALEGANAYVADIDKFVTTVRRLFLVAYDLEKRTYEEGMPSEMYEPKIRPRINRAKDAVSFAIAYADGERQLRMDLVAAILAGTGVIVSIWALTPMTMEKILSAFIVLLIFISFSKIISDRLVRWALWVFKKLANLN